MSEIYISKNIKRLRTFYGYRQREVAERLHISRQAYSNYERGARIPDIGTIICLAKFYRISLDCLVLSADPARRAMEQTHKGNAALTPAGSLIPMSGAELKMVLRYKGLPRQEREEVEEFVAFKEAHSRRDEGKASKNKE